MRKQAQFIGLISILLTGLIVGAAGAQTVPHSGPLAWPVPYFGTHTLGDPPIVYPPPNSQPMNPLKYWRSQILFGRGGYGGSTIIISPGYYYPGGWPYSYYGNYVTPPYNPYYGMAVGNGYYGSLPLGFGAGVYQAHSTAQYRVVQPSKPSGGMVVATNGHPKEQAISSYYLATPTVSKAIKAAMADIEKAWQTNSPDLLAKYVDPSSTIEVSVEGSSPYSLGGAKYLKRTETALKSMKTLAFNLNKAVETSKGQWVVSGFHRFEMPDGQSAELGISFTLHQSEGRVTITKEGVSNTSG
ncbi:MAG: hypothetical protein M1330_01135 [Armatimonadetes bacterium]|nr:hypothetical protein [Armatimonadota bacterium]